MTCALKCAAPASRSAPGRATYPREKCSPRPALESVEGYIRYNIPVRFNGMEFKGVRLGFERGRIVDIRCESGDAAALEAIFDTDEGARYIGEFAMGTNPFVDRVVGDILFDEKAAGSFHFTPGTPTRAAANGNKSGIHWDMVYRMQSEYGGQRSGLMTRSSSATAFSCRMSCSLSTRKICAGNWRCDMEYTLESLREHEMFRWFIEISSVPRGSGNTKAISELTADFASVRGLQYERDALGNVVITKPASPRKENCEPIMLQAHLDMVCAAQSGKNIDMSVTPPQLVIDGDWLRADGTTLGADNGIGVAMMFALLDNTDTVHPPLVCVFTVDEEDGHGRGVRSRQEPSRLQTHAQPRRGKGGRVLRRVRRRQQGGGQDTSHVLGAGRDSWRIELDGLAGGHSGVDIDRGRAAAPVLMGRVLMELRCSAEMRCARLECGQADNAIADHATADVVCAAGF